MSFFDQIIKDYPTTVIEEAQKWLGCKEVTQNRSACVDEIKQLATGEVTNEPWCAQYVTAVMIRTSARFAMLNPLTNTKSTAVMLADAKKKGITVDKLPTPGSIFYKTRPGGGHVGFVVEVDGDEFKTIEGNAGSGSDSVTWGKRNLTTVNYSFIHAEEKFAGKELIIGLSPTYYVAGVIAGVALYLNNKRKGSK